jgi:hypothetical protein
MFSKHDQLQGYDDALLAAIDAQEQRHELIASKMVERVRAQVADLCASFPVYAN